MNLRVSKKQLVTIAQYLLLIAVIGFAAYYIVQMWPDVVVALDSVTVRSGIVSFIAVLLGLLAITMAWVTLLNGLGEPIPTLRASQIMLVGQLGKYVPGSVWSFVMQMELGRHYGVNRVRVLVAGLYAAGIGVVCSLLLGAGALPTVAELEPALVWLLLILPVGLVCLHPRVMTKFASLVLRVFKRPPLAHRVTWRVVLTSSAWTLLGYALYGFHLWILVNSFTLIDVKAYMLLMGGLSLSLTASLFAFVLPSGVGVREVILVAVMGTLISQAQSAAMSLVSRAMFTGAEVLTALIAMGFLFAMRRKRGVLEPADDIDMLESTGASDTTEVQEPSAHIEQTEAPGASGKPVE